MLNIQPVSFIRNFNLRNNNQKNYVSSLAPLKCDTISFSGARNLNHSLQDAFDNKEICEEISKNAKPAKDCLEKSLTRVFSDIVASSNNLDGIIEPISVRIKDGTSIREKATSKFEEAIVNHDLTNFINLNKTEDIKKVIQDLVGARIIVNQSNPKVNAAIIDRLITLVKSGELKIKKIEIITPKEETGLQPYFEEDDLERLKDAVNMTKKSSDKIDIGKNPSKSGYSAIHIDLDLSDENMLAKNDGYKGEIQIIGSDVAYFKDLEDYCYKVKQNKDIKSGHPAYNAFVQHLNKYFEYRETGNSESENKKTANKYKEAFERYTYKAYIIQRRKSPNDPQYSKTHLPTIEECGMKGEVPPDLDFNYLQKIRTQCDKFYELCDKNKIGYEVDIEYIQTYNTMVNDMLRGVDTKVAKQIKKVLDQIYNLTTPQNLIL